jgi:hypothetical protein
MFPFERTHAAGASTGECSVSKRTVQGGVDRDYLRSNEPWGWGASSGDAIPFGRTCGPGGGARNAFGSDELRGRGLEPGGMPPARTDFATRGQPLATVGLLRVGCVFGWFTNLPTSAGDLENGLSSPAPRYAPWNG